MTGDSTEGTVLVVDDEEAYVEAYATWLEERYRVRTATGGQEALERVDPDVDVALLDRRMPDLTGDEVLSTIRERGLDCRVAMLTAVDPGFDVVEMRFDEYLVKPVSRDRVLSAVETLLHRATLDETLRECYALVSKRAALESRMSESDLEDAEEYRELLDRIDALEAELDQTLDGLIEEGAVAGAYRDIGT